MIIDSASIIDLASGAERRVIQLGDGQILVPSVLQPVVDHILPTLIPVFASQVNRTSFLLDSFINVQNAVDTTSIVCTLAAGMWDLDMGLNSQFNFAKGLPLLIGTLIVFSYQGQTVSLMGRQPSIGSFYDVRKVRILTRDISTLSVRTGLNGVGQATDLVFQISAARVL